MNLSDEFVIPSKPALASPSTQLTPQLKKLRRVHKSPQTPTRPRQINSSRLPRTRTVTRTVVRIIKVQKNEENRKICRLKRKIKSLKVDIRSSKQIAEQKLAEERVCLLVHW